LFCCLFPWVPPLWPAQISIARAERAVLSRKTPEVPPALTDQAGGHGETVTIRVFGKASNPLEPRTDCRL
jgi:hypothetical protein